MGQYVLYNGNFYPAQAALVAAGSRGLRYGDGLFETMRVVGGTIRHAHWHLERLFNGLGQLGFELPSYFTPDFIASQVQAICARNGHDHARVRLNIIRGNGDLYQLQDTVPGCIVESWDWAAADVLNETGLVTGMYTEARKSIDNFSHLKSNNFLPYAMAALQAQKNKWDDAILLNAAGRICDATTANIFIVKKGSIFTPALQEGCVAGIMRRHLLAQLPALGFHLTETAVQVQDLEEADEIFLTNAVRGIRWIGSCGPTAYGNQLTKAVFAALFKN